MAIVWMVGKIGRAIIDTSDQLRKRLRKVAPSINSVQWLSRAFGIIFPD